MKSNEYGKMVAIYGRNCFDWDWNSYTFGAWSWFKVVVGLS